MLDQKLCLSFIVVCDLIQYHEAHVSVIRASQKIHKVLCCLLKNDLCLLLFVLDYSNMSLFVVYKKVMAVLAKVIFETYILVSFLS